MLHKGDRKGMVRLAPLGGEKGTYGVGALAGLRGEVLLWDGKMLVSRGHSRKGTTEAAAASDEAVLFVVARVQEWREVSVPRDMTQPQFDAFVIATAKEQGIDTGAAFPFLVRDARLDLVWHVVTGEADGGHAGGHGGGTHQLGHAGQDVFRESVGRGMLAGFHSGAALEGVISHPGERFHVHYANPDLSVSGHVDEYRVGVGAILMLPRR
jgi:alpha-acetolactate decarboxylase